jgi:hypothetical protein
VLVADRTGYSAPVTFKQRSAASQSVAPADDGGLVVAWAGTDRWVNLLTVGPDWGDPVRLEAKTSAAPALCSHNGELLLAWAGSDAHLNVARLG